jgi:E3 ubiquitin-protein ligase MARCH6
MHFYFRVSDPFTEIPADMLLFQICIPFAIEHFKWRTTIKSLLHYWFTAVGWALGLTDFILPGPEDSGGQGNGNAEQGRQDRLQVAQLGGQDQAVVALAAADDQNRTTLTAGSSAEEDDSDEQSDSEYALCATLLTV